MMTNLKKVLEEIKKDIEDENNHENFVCIEVPVTWESYGTISVSGVTGFEEIKKVALEKASLPQGYYVDDSIRLSTEDREEFLPMTDYFLMLSNNNFEKLREAFRSLEVRKIAFNKKEVDDIVIGRKSSGSVVVQGLVKGEMFPIYLFVDEIEDLGPREAVFFSLNQHDLLYVLEEYYGISPTEEELIPFIDLLQSNIGIDWVEEIRVCLDVRGEDLIRNFKKGREKNEKA